LKGQISEAIVTEKPNVKWEDVSGLENAKNSLK
jgi:vacuolar protein-sorting-associated protein 4